MTDLADRYGTRTTTGRKGLVAVIVVLAGLGLSWLSWVMLVHGRPLVQSEIVHGQRELLQVIHAAHFVRLLPYPLKGGRQGGRQFDDPRVVQSERQLLAIHFGRQQRDKLIEVGHIFAGVYLLAEQTESSRNPVVQCLRSGRGPLPLASHTPRGQGCS